MSDKPKRVRISDHCATCGKRPLLLLTFARFDGGFVTLCFGCSPMSPEDEQEGRRES